MSQGLDTEYKLGYFKIKTPQVKSPRYEKNTTLR